MISNPKFDQASKYLAQHFGPQIDQDIRRYEHAIWLDSDTELQIFPSNVVDFPIGATLRAYSRDGGMNLENPVGLFADYSFLLPVVERLVKGDEASYEPDRIAVDPRTVQVGDLIADFGFTVGGIKTINTAGRGLVTILRDGDRTIPLELGYEFLVTRGWEGHSELLEYFMPSIGMSVRERLQYDNGFDAEALLAWADTYKIDLRSCDLTDDEFDEVQTCAIEQAAVRKLSSINKI